MIELRRVLEWKCGVKKKLKVGSASERHGKVVKRVPDRAQSIISMSDYKNKCCIFWEIIRKKQWGGFDFYGGHELVIVVYM